MSDPIKINVQTDTTDEDQMALGSFYAYTVNNPERKESLLKFVPVKDANNVYKDIGNVAPNPYDNSPEYNDGKSEVKSKTKINGKHYQLDMAYSDSDDGTDVQVWTNTDSGESIFVAQGSQSLDIGHQDGKDDFNLGAGKNPTQYQHAYDIYIKVNKARAKVKPHPLSPITKLVGNSLGVVVVSYIGKKEKEKPIFGIIPNVIAINPSPVPGMGEGNYSNIKTISANDDVLSIASKSIGIFTSGEEINVGSRAGGSYLKEFGRLNRIIEMVYGTHLGVDKNAGYKKPGDELSLLIISRVFNYFIVI